MSFTAVLYTIKAQYVDFLPQEQHKGLLERHGASRRDREGLRDIKDGEKEEKLISGEQESDIFWEAASHLA